MSTAGSGDNPAGAVSAGRLAVAFARRLRAAGLDVPVGSVIVFVDALGALGIDRRTGVYWAGRASLVHQPSDMAVYDEVFTSFWEGRGAAADDPDRHEKALVALVDDEDGASEHDDAPPAERAAPTVAVRYSAVEVLRHKDFAAYSPDEHAEARRLMADLRLAAALRRGRRLRPAHRSRRQPDLRRTVRAALRTGGEPIRRSWVAPAPRPRHVVILCDISGSMEPYAAALMRFVHAAVAGGSAAAGGSSRVEAFALGTRLTRLTRQLTWRDPDAALAAATRAVPDWSGGTRLGEGLRAFNDQWGIRGMARGAVVVILSDGWDRGAPEVLGEQMARLQRVAHRVVWVNPLKSSPDYAPLARGMAAALPFVDEFVEGHSLAALESLAEVISR